MSLVNLFKKFWLQHKIEETRSQYTLPLSDIINQQYYSGRPTRAYTVEIYTNESYNLVKIAEDDGFGNLVDLTTDGALSTATGQDNTVNYTDNKVTVYWNTTFLAALTTNPILKFKYTSLTKEEHAQLLDFLGEVFYYYKQNELDARTDYYDPAAIPNHLIDTLAKDHNWLIDRIYSEEESYLRRQLKFLYKIYKSKRRLDGIFYSISVINRRVNFYNLLAEKGEYNDYTKYIIFDTLTLFEALNEATPGTQQETIASQIQAVYDSLYAPSSDYFPTKHFLLDLALDILTSDSNLLNAVDITTLKNYTLRIKSATQYPHFQAYLGLEAPPSLTQQSSIPFQFKLTDSEQIFSISEYRTLYTGPQEVKSMAQLGDGAWAILPLLMNNGHWMNEGLIHNMQLGDVENYLTYFKLGKGGHTTIDAYLGSLDDSFFTSNDMTIIYDDDYYYMTLIVNESEANAYPITEVGIYNDQNKLAFYIKHPRIYKTEKHKLKYRLKLQVTGIIV